MSAPLPTQVRALCAFVEEMGRWPSRYAPPPTSAEQGVPGAVTERELARWLANQRQHASPERRAELDEHLPGWRDSSTSFATFEQRLQELEVFVTRTGRIPSAPRDDKAADAEERSLTSWLRLVGSDAAADRRELLERAAPGWHEALSARRPKLDMFERRLAALRAHLDTRGTWPASRSANKLERNLAVWVRERRRIATPGERARLDEVVPGWDVPRQPGPGTGRSDDQRLAELRAFITERGRMPSRRDVAGVSALANWAYLRSRREGELGRELRRLMVETNPDNIRWQERLDDVRAHLAAGRRLTYSDDTKPLREWLGMQRHRASSERQAILDENLPGWRTGHPSLAAPGKSLPAAA